MCPVYILFVSKYFFTAFKAYYGKTPKEFQKEETA